MSESIFTPNTTMDTDADATTASEPMDTTHGSLDETPLSNRPASTPPRRGKGSRRPKTPGSTRSKRVKGADRAGIVFPVGRIRKYLKEFDPGHRHSTKSATFMASVLEYLIFELVSETVPYTKKSKKKRITPRHLRMCVGNDPDFSVLLKDVIFSEGGVIPHIHEVLLPQRPNNTDDEGSDE